MDANGRSGFRFPAHGPPHLNIGIPSLVNACILSMYQGAYGVGNRNLHRA